MEEAIGLITFGKKNGFEQFYAKGIEHFSSTKEGKQLLLHTLQLVFRKIRVFPKSELFCISRVAYQDRVYAFLLNYGFSLDAFKRAGYHGGAIVLRNPSSRSDLLISYLDILRQLAADQVSGKAVEPEIPDLLRLSEELSVDPTTDFVSLPGAGNQEGLIQTDERRVLVEDLMYIFTHEGARLNEYVTLYSTIDERIQAEMDTSVIELLNPDMLREDFQRIVAYEATADDRQAWQKALAHDTQIAFEQYLQQYPEGIHHAEARYRLQDLNLFHKALKTQAREDVVTYLERFPQGKHAEQAHQLLQQIDQRIQHEEELWQLACDEPRMERLQAYLEAFPEGKYHREARHYIQEIRAWQQAEYQGTKVAYELYLETYPSGLYQTLADYRLREITEYHRIIHSRDTDALLRFLATYEESTMTEAVESRLIEIDTEMWETAQASATPAAYQYYIQHAPLRLQADTAQQRLQVTSTIATAQKPTSSFPYSTVSPTPSRSTTTKQNKVKDTTSYKNAPTVYIDPIWEKRISRARDSIDVLGKRVRQLTANRQIMWVVVGLLCILMGVLIVIPYATRTNSTPATAMETPSAPAPSNTNGNKQTGSADVVPLKKNTGAACTVSDAVYQNAQSYLTTSKNRVQAFQRELSQVYQNDISSLPSAKTQRKFVAQNMQILARELGKKNQADPGITQNCQITKIDSLREELLSFAATYYESGLRRDAYGYVEHEVKEKETTYAISRRYGADIAAIITFNDLDENGTIKVGQKLRIYHER